MFSVQPLQAHIPKDAEDFVQITPKRGGKEETSRLACIKLRTGRQLHLHTSKLSILAPNEDHFIALSSSLVLKKWLFAVVSFENPCLPQVQNF